MSDTTPLIRQWLILRTLARREGGAVREMAVEYGVTQKTIRRDLNTLASSGFPLVEEIGPHGKKFWRVQFAADGAAVQFNVDELVALYLGRRFLEPLAGTSFGKAANDAFRKIRATVSDSALAYLETLASTVHRTTFGTADYGWHTEVLDALLTAVEDQRTVVGSYHSLSSDDPKPVELHPYGLVFHRDSLYVVGFVPEHGELRRFKLNRFREAQLADGSFDRPGDFDLDAHLRESFGVFVESGEAVTVRVRFGATVARFVEESNWHPSQRLQRLEDGGLDAEFDLVGTEELRAWVLSFGRHAEVLAPKALRRTVADEVRAMAMSYDGEDREGQHG